MRHRFGFDIGAAALITAAALSTVPALATQSANPTCFFRRAWLGGWRATADARTIYIRVSNTIYRLELQMPYSLLKDPFATLINRGSADTICTPLDFTLTVSNRVGAVQWPIVKEFTRLTPDQAAALPKKLRP